MATIRQRGETFRGYTELDVKCCPVCGVLYAAPARLFDNAWRTGENWFCLNGHSLVMTETKKDEDEKKGLRGQLAMTRAELDQTEAGRWARMTVSVRRVPMPEERQHPELNAGEPYRVINPLVNAVRVDELQAAAADRPELTVATLIEELAG